jgi:hypothetical protein
MSLLAPRSAPPAPRREVGEAGAFDALTDEELMQEAVKRARELGIASPHLVEDDNS